MYSVVDRPNTPGPAMIGSLAWAIGIAIIALIILMVLAHLLGLMCLFDGFRSEDEKQQLARQLVAGGKPEFGPLKSMGLDGAEYYEARQLWNRKKYTPRNLEGIL